MENPSHTGRRGLGRGQRLKSRKRIQSLFRDGGSFSSGTVRTVVRARSEEPFLVQAGFTVSSKHFAKAVDRNRIKRLLREAWRLQRFPLEEALGTHRQSLDVFLIYTGREVPCYSDVSERVSKIIDRLVKSVSRGD
jgi:ribonuclease P protein component